MAFPSTAIQDLFNRSDGPIGSDWSGNTTSYSISSNQLSTSVNGYIIWNKAVFGANQEVYIDVVTLPATSWSEIDVLLKLPTTTSTSYCIEVMFTDAGTAEVWYNNNGTWSQAGTAITLSASLQNGDQIGARALDDGTVEVYLNGTLEGSRDASSYTYYDQTGYTGIWFVSDGGGYPTWDDFGSGTYITGGVDSATKRGSSIQVGKPFVTTLPFPNSSINGEDRAHGSSAYSGFYGSVEVPGSGQSTSLAGARGTPLPATVGSGNGNALASANGASAQVVSATATGSTRATSSASGHVSTDGGHTHYYRVATQDAMMNDLTSTNKYPTSQLYVGESATQARIWRALIDFDFTGLPHAKYDLTSVKFHAVMAWDNATNDGTSHLYRLRRDFVEAQVDWVQASNGTNWATLGAGSAANDYENVSLGSATHLDGVFPVPCTWDLTPSKIKEIMDGTWAYPGFLWKMASEVDDLFVFSSTDYAGEVHTPPTLVLSFQHVQVAPTLTYPSSSGVSAATASGPGRALAYSSADGNVTSGVTQVPGSGTGTALARSSATATVAAVASGASVAIASAAWSLPYVDTLGSGQNTALASSSTTSENSTDGSANGSAQALSASSSHIAVSESGNSVSLAYSSSSGHLAAGAYGASTAFSGAWAFSLATTVGNGVSGAISTSSSQFLIETGGSGQDTSHAISSVTSLVTVIETGAGYSLAWSSAAGNAEVVTGNVYGAGRSLSLAISRGTSVVVTVASADARALAGTNGTSHLATSEAGTGQSLALTSSSSLVASVGAGQADTLGLANASSLVASLGSGQSVTLAFSSSEAGPIVTIAVADGHTLAQANSTAYLVISGAGEDLTLAIAQGNGLLVLSGSGQSLAIAYSSADATIDISAVAGAGFGTSLALSSSQSLVSTDVTATAEALAGSTLSSHVTTSGGGDQVSHCYTSTLSEILTAGDGSSVALGLSQSTGTYDIIGQGYGQSLAVEAGSSLIETNGAGVGESIAFSQVVGYVLVFDAQGYGYAIAISASEGGGTVDPDIVFAVLYVRTSTSDVMNVRSSMTDVMNVRSSLSEEVYTRTSDSDKIYTRDSIQETVSTRTSISDKESEL